MTNDIATNSSFISQEKSSVASTQKFTKDYLKKYSSKIPNGYEILYIQIDSITKFSQRNIFSVFFEIEVINKSTNDVVCFEKTPVRSKEVLSPNIGLYIPIFPEKQNINVKAYSGTYEECNLLGYSSFDFSKITKRVPNKAPPASIKFFTSESKYSKSQIGILNLKLCFVDVSRLRFAQSEDLSDYSLPNSRTTSFDNQSNVQKSIRISNFQRIIKSNVDELLQSDYVCPKWDEISSHNSTSRGQYSESNADTVSANNIRFMNKKDSFSNINTYSTFYVSKKNKSPNKNRGEDSDFFESECYDSVRKFKKNALIQEDKGKGTMLSMVKTPLRSRTKCKSLFKSETVTNNDKQSVNDLLDQTNNELSQNSCQSDDLRNRIKSQKQDQTVISRLSKLRLSSIKKN